jgi:predicted DNA-binding protein (MmcQ/YjbR family)
MRFESEVVMRRATDGAAKEVGRRVDARFERAVFSRARRLCLALPETTETSSWGHPNFRAGNKTFCVFEIVHGRPSIGFRLEPADVRRVVHGANGFDTPYGRQRWASVWVDSEVDWALIKRLIKRSYLVVANKRASPYCG